MDKKIKKIDVDGEIYECHVDHTLMPFIERILKGKTDSDEAIEALSIPNRPIWLQLFVRILRWYRHRISSRMGNRCVFEPSCSHYAEIVFRKEGLVRGLILTCKRLYRCRPGSGGIDLPRNFKTEDICNTK